MENEKEKAKPEQSKSDNRRGIIKDRMNKVIVSETANPKLIEYFKSLGVRVEKVTNHNGSAIGSHADLYYCQLFCDEVRKNKITSRINEEKTHRFKEDSLENNKRGIKNVYEGDISIVGSAYPDDCIYNAACTGKHFIHNTKISDPDLMGTVQMFDISIIHVKQGYAKCNCVVVDENSIITSDSGIAVACRDKLDCLLISPGSIYLKGFRYGFLGGCSGRISDEIVFNGDLSGHPDHHTIVEFIKMRHLNVRYFPDYPLTDIGSIISCID